jgi:cytochrome b6-f complex iron-sulfur subunit
MDPTRRDFVRIAGLALIGACAGCSGSDTTGGGSPGGDTDGDSEGRGDSDVTGTGDTAVPAGWAALTLDANPKLGDVGGYVVRKLGGVRVVVARLDDAPTFLALSAACTHQGCDVQYQAAKDRFYCPCHGSVFADDGRVVQGPARRPLTSFDTQWDEANQRVLVRTS